MTQKRVAVVVILIWVWSFASLSVMWVSFDIFSLTIAVIGIVCVLLTTMVYIRIYLVVRRHRNQIQALQVQQETQAGERATFAGLISSAVGVFCVYLMFLICYLPFFISLAAYKINGHNVTMKKFFLFVLTLSTSWPVVFHRDPCWDRFCTLCTQPRLQMSSNVMVWGFTSMLMIPRYTCHSILQMPCSPNH